MKTGTGNSKRVARENWCDLHLAGAPRAVSTTQMGGGVGVGDAPRACVGGRSPTPDGCSLSLCCIVREQLVNPFVSPGSHEGPAQSNSRASQLRKNVAGKSVYSVQTPFLVPL